MCGKTLKPAAKTEGDNSNANNISIFFQKLY